MGNYLVGLQRGRTVTVRMLCKDLGGKNALRPPPPHFQENGWVPLRDGGDKCGVVKIVVWSCFLTSFREEVRGVNSAELPLPGTSTLPNLG